MAQKQSGERPKPGSLKLLEVQSDPLNCETPISTLSRAITPNNLFYVRTHFPIPSVKSSDWRLAVEGIVDTPIQLSLNDLRKLKQRTVTVTLECAGNTRSLFRIPSKELQWGRGAVGTARWSGVPVCELLEKAGLGRVVREVIFEGADRGEEPGSSRAISFTRSLPLRKAMDPDTIVALRMNDKPLPQEHGHPARLIVPGWYAMASVKWLNRMVVSSKPFKGFFQTTKYVYERPHARRPVSSPIRELRVKSLITRPLDGEVLEKRPMNIRGVAWSGKNRISKVEISLNRRQHAATLLPSPRRYAWTPWKIGWTPSRSGTFTISVRATDEKGNTQPIKPIPDRYQYGYNAIDKVRVRVS
jgi:DMSO/TMAO reductase YedYZ molybdopterin-dependent catalytic subunit